MYKLTILYSKELQKVVGRKDSILINIMIKKIVILKRHLETTSENYFSFHNNQILT